MSQTRVLSEKEIDAVAGGFLPLLVAAEVAYVGGAAVVAGAAFAGGTILLGKTALAIASYVNEEGDVPVAPGTDDGDDDAAQGGDNEHAGE